MENNFINFRFIESFGECCAWTESAVSNAPARLGLKNHDTVKLVDKMQSGNDSLQKKILAKLNANQAPKFLFCFCVVPM